MTAHNREPVEYLAGEMPLHRYCAHHAAQTPERIALLWYGRTICWRELDQLSTRLAVQFQRLGVARGHRVALFLQNCPQAILALVTVGFDGIHRSSMATAASGCRPDLRKRPFHSRRRTECDPAPRGLHENLPYGIESRRKSAATSIGEKRETGFPATRARHARSTC